MTTALFRAARAAGLVLVALSAGSSAAFALGPPAAYSGAPAATVLHSAGLEMRSGGGQPRDVFARVSARAGAPSEAGRFDFADASVGAVAAVAVVFVVAGTARAVNRRRWHAELTAGRR